MSVHNMQSGACCKCGGWTGRARMTLCVDCKRERDKPTIITCGYEGCTERFVKRGAIQYCVLHRGLRRNGKAL